jgi:hypothetical protein
VLNSPTWQLWIIWFHTMMIQQSHVNSFLILTAAQ